MQDPKSPENFNKLKDIHLSEDDKALLWMKIDVAIKNDQYEAFEPTATESMFGWISLGLQKLSKPATVFVPASLVVATLFISAATALPGDMLYGVKTSINEPIQRLAHLNTESKLEFDKSLMTKRVKEAKELKDRGLLTIDSAASIEKQITAQADKLILNTSNDNSREKSNDEDAVKIEENKDKIIIAEIKGTAAGSIDAIKLLASDIEFEDEQVNADADNKDSVPANGGEIESRDKAEEESAESEDTPNDSDKVVENESAEIDEVDNKDSIQNSGGEDLKNRESVTDEQIDKNVDDEASVNSSVVSTSSEVTDSATSKSNVPNGEKASALDDNKSNKGAKKFPGENAANQVDAENEASGLLDPVEETAGLINVSNYSSAQLRIVEKVSGVDPKDLTELEFLAALEQATAITVLESLAAELE